MIPQPFASVMTAATKVQQEKMLIVVLIPTDEQALEELAARFESFSECATHIANITKKKPQTNLRYYVKRKRIELRRQQQEVLINEFGPLVELTHPQPYLPLIKIVGLPPLEPQGVLDQIIRCNNWISPDTKIHRHYSIIYSYNIDLKVSKLWEINRAKSLVVENCYWDRRASKPLNAVIFFSACRSQPACKHCGEVHQSSSCEAMEQSKCINRMTKGLPIYFHTATADQCPQRKNRLNVMKGFYWDNIRASQSAASAKNLRQKTNEGIQSNDITHPDESMDVIVAGVMKRNREE